MIMHKSNSVSTKLERGHMSIKSEQYILDLQSSSLQDISKVNHKSFLLHFLTLK